MYPPLISIVEDDPVAGELYRVLLVAAGQQVRVFSSTEEFFAQPPHRGAACVLLKLDAARGLEVQKALAAAGRCEQVVFVTDAGNAAACVRAMKAGAVDCLCRPFSNDALLRALAAALDRSAAVRREQAEQATARLRLAQLTRRERTVLQLVLTGIPNREIGARLGIAEGTIKIHRRRVMEKMAADSVVDLVLLSQRAGVPIQNRLPAEGDPARREAALPS